MLTNFGGSMRVRNCSLPRQLTRLSYGTSCEWAAFHGVADVFKKVRTAVADGDVRRFGTAVFGTG